VGVVCWAAIWLTFTARLAVFAIVTGCITEDGSLAIPLAIIPPARPVVRTAKRQGCNCWLYQFVVIMPPKPPATIPLYMPESPPNAAYVPEVT